MSEMRELTDTEVDAVCGAGGLFTLPNINITTISIPNVVTQTNTPTQVAIGVGGTAANVLGTVANLSSIF
jgi:hypothetical protein